MAESTGVTGPQQITLGDKILAVGCIDIAVKRDRIGDRSQPDVVASRIDRIDIAIELVIVAILRGRTEAQLVAEIMFHPQLHNVRLQGGAVGSRLTEQSVPVAGKRAARVGKRTAIASRAQLGRIPAVYGAVIIHIFIGKQYPVVVVKLGTEGRVDREPSAVIKIAVVVELFVETVEPEGRCIADRQIEVAAEIIGAETVHTCRHFAKLAISDRRFGHPVDDSAAAAATEDHRVGSLVDLDPLDIVKWPEILNIIAYAIDEKIGGGILSPDGELIAIALALADGCAGRIAKNIPDILKRLIIQLFAGYHGDRLRRTQQRGVGFQARAADRDIAFLFAGYDNLLIISHALFPDFLSACL